MNQQQQQQVSARLDNASIYHSGEMIDFINATGSVIIYSAPYKSTSNTIENNFFIYKKYL